MSGGLGFEDLLATPLALDNYTRTDGFKSSPALETNNDDIFAQYERQQAKAHSRRRGRGRVNTRRPVCDIGYDDLDATSVSALARMKKSPSKRAADKPAQAWRWPPDGVPSK